MAQNSIAAKKNPLLNNIFPSNLKNKILYSAFCIEFLHGSIPSIHLKSSMYWGKPCLLWLLSYYFLGSFCMNAVFLLIST